MRFNGEPFDKHERIGVNIASVKKLPKPIQPGEQLTFQTTADYIGVFPDNIEWLSVFVPHPIGTIDYWVHFNEGDLPKKFANIITMSRPADTLMFFQLHWKTKSPTFAYITQT